MKILHKFDCPFLVSDDRIGSILLLHMELMLRLREKFHILQLRFVDYGQNSTSSSCCFNYGHVAAFIIQMVYFDCFW